MLFTGVIWIFSALFLLTAVLFYVFFLFHWIPRADGGLSGYCERKITESLIKVVTTKVNKALAKQESDRFRAEVKAAKKNGEKFPLDRQGTLPTLPNIGFGADDKLPEMPMLGRNDTMTTLPPYTSNPGTPGPIETGAFSQKRPMPSRTGTMASATSYSSRAPLMGAAAELGYVRTASPAPSMPEVDLKALPPQRTATSNSQRGFGPRPPMAHMHTTSNSSLRMAYTDSPGPMHSETMSPVRSPTARTMDNYTQPMGPMARVAYDSGRASPAPSITSVRSGPMPRQPGPMGPVMRSATGPLPPRGPQYPPSRNMTAPMPPRAPAGDYFDRPPTSQSMRGPPAYYSNPSQGPRGQQNYGYDVEAQGGNRYQY